MIRMHKGYVLLGVLGAAVAGFLLSTGLNLVPEITEVTEFIISQIGPNPHIPELLGLVMSHPVIVLLPILIEIMYSGALGTVQKTFGNFVFFLRVSSRGLYPFKDLNILPQSVNLDNLLFKT